MGLLKVIDYVNQCYSNEDGDIVRGVILQNFENGEKTVVSFEGVYSASSSFINSAFIELLETHNFNFIKENLTFIKSSKTINETIKRRFMFEVNERKNMINV